VVPSMSEPSTASTEEALLRRRIRDVVALSTLPAIWGNADARQIAERTAEVLIGMLHLEFAAVILTGQPPIEVIRLRGGGMPDWKIWLRDLLASRTMPRAVKEVFESAAPGGAALRVSCVSMGLGKEGTLITASTAADYPNETERLLLDVAANQAALALRRWHSDEALRDNNRTLAILNRTGAVVAANIDLESIVQTVTEAATELSGAQFGAFFYNLLDDKGESYTLYSISGVPREAFSKFPMPRNTAVFNPTFRGEGTIRSDDIRKDPRYGQNPPYNGMPEGHLPVVSYLAVPVISRSGEVLGGLFFGHKEPGVFCEPTEKIVAGIAAQAAVAIDNARLFKAAQSELAERRRVEKHQDLLLAELNHRVKNTLAIVLSIATQTLRHADTAETFRAGFEARIMALAEAHNLLTESNWEGASLRAMIERVLTPYRGVGEPRYILAGTKDIQIGPRMAVALVMALNELATNAAKYGALSDEKGQVNVSWAIAEGGEPGYLRVKWAEIGGPPVNPPERKGFGSRLIRSLSEDEAGKVEMEFAPTGLVCTFDLPLPAGTAL
jgi:two-component sensor histidine kinase